MSCELVIWDFNGTLLDDVSVGIDSVNALLSKRGMKTLSGVDEYYAVFGFPIIDYYRRLGFDFTKESYDTVAHEWVNEYLSRVPEAPLREGITEVLERIKEKNVPQMIMSATEENMLKEQIGFLGIKEYFFEIIGNSDIYAHSKKERAEEWIKKQDVKNVLFIGDTLHDLQVANAIGAHCILLEGGHQSREVLESSKAFVTDTNGLLSIINCDCPQYF